MASHPAPMNSLHTLPAELLDGVISLLCPEDVASVSATSKLLRSHAVKESVWQAFITANTHRDIPYPSHGTFRDLYLAHQSHWFLTRHQLWFNDYSLTGSLIFIRYDPARECIDGYTVVAERGPHDHGFLSWDGGEVLYDTFNPTARLDFNQAKLRLDRRQPSTVSNHFHHETVMDTQSRGPESITFRTVFMHTKALNAETVAEPSVQVWPPRILPSAQRVRNQSASSFKSVDHAPRSTRAVCDTSFRIRAWMEFPSLPITPVPRFGQRFNREVVYTYGTLPREAYTPTPEKPWQGIWCGDYNTHGVEFLVIMQPDDPLPLPKKARRAFRQWPDINAEDVNTLLYGQHEDDDWEDAAELFGQNYASVTSMVGNGVSDDDWGTSSLTGPPSDATPYRGRLEAVKLTGDPNVPRGEYTFIAKDLGEKGLVKLSTEPIFNDDMTTPKDGFGAQDGTAGSIRSCLPNRATEGARVVRAVGHVAGHGFTSNAYIPTQLVLVSENTLAQYWKPWRHISFYKRVDLDALTKI